MNLREKLERIDLDPEPRRRENISAPLGRRLSDYLPGSEVSTPHGPCFSVRWEYDLDYHHGSFPLQRLTGLSSEEVRTLTFDESLSKFDLSKAAFLDVETSSLSGGVGTFAFLIGVAYLFKDKLCVEQYLMRDFIEEPNMLYVLAQTLNRCLYLVTYNGKCYDTSILSARYVLNRQRTPHDRLPHLDLLFPARRLWKRRFGDCSLTNLESAILSFQRTEDIPSHLIPQIYFDYLRDNDPQMLVPVFNHNRDDLVSLAALTGVACELVREDRPHFMYDPVDLLSLGRHFYNAGRHEKTVSMLEAIPREELPGEFKREYCLLLGDCYKRVSRWDEAERVWWSYLESGQSPAVHFQVELAKLYEHRIRDLPRAREITLMALSGLDSPSSEMEPRTMRIRRGELLHRLQRIERKESRRAPAKT